MRPVVQLVLRGSDINPNIKSYTNNYPTEPTADYTAANGSFVNRWRTRKIFAGINWRSVLGELYEDGATYEMQLVNIVSGLTSTGGVYTTLENNRLFNVFMKGINGMRSWKNGMQSDEVLLSTIRIPSGGIGLIHQTPNTAFTFHFPKGQQNPTSNIEIQLRDFLLDQLEPVPSTFTTAPPNLQFTFNIRRI